VGVVVGSVTVGIAHVEAQHITGLPTECEQRFSWSGGYELLGRGQRSLLNPWGLPNGRSPGYVPTLLYQFGRAYINECIRLPDSHFLSGSSRDYH
jgi:hypothetical protein